MCAKSLQLCPTLCNPWTVAHQAPLSMGFSGQEYWSVSPCPPPGDLPDLGIKPASLTSPALAGGIFTTTATWEAQRRPMAVQVGWARTYSSCYKGSECVLTAACEDWWFLILSSCRMLWTQVMKSHKQQSLALLHQTPNCTRVSSFSFGVISFPEKGNDSRGFWYFHSDVTIRRPRQGHDLHIDYPSQDCEKPSRYIRRINVDSDCWSSFWITHHLVQHSTASVLWGKLHSEYESFLDSFIHQEDIAISIVHWSWNASPPTHTF